MQAIPYIQLFFVFQFYGKNKNSRWCNFRSFYLPLYCIKKYMQYVFNFLNWITRKIQIYSWKCLLKLFFYRNILTFFVVLCHVYIEVLKYYKLIFFIDFSINNLVLGSSIIPLQINYHCRLIYRLNVLYKNRIFQNIINMICQIMKSINAVYF